MRSAALTAFVGIFAACALAPLQSAWSQNGPVPLNAPKNNGGIPRPPAGMQPGPPPMSGPQVSSPFSAKSSQPGGFDANQRALIDRVSLYLSTIQTLTGDFVQVGPDGNRSEGQFFLQKPGKINFTYNPPSVIQVVADGSSVVVRDTRLATQDLYPLSQTPLRFLLADKLDLMRDTTVQSVSSDDVFVTVVIEEKQAVIGTSRLMMMFGAKDLQLRQWTVTDPQGFDTTVAVYNLDTNKKPDPRMFVINYDNNSQRVQ
ncbi:MAG: outer membrane lipoprotein carrier protein LolA [Xanthobacteraceae bacterium]